MSLWQSMASRLSTLLSVVCLLSFFSSTASVWDVFQIELPTSSREEEAAVAMMIHTFSEPSNKMQATGQSVDTSTVCRGKEQLISILRSAETNETNACTVMKFSRFQRRFVNVTKVNCSYEEICTSLPWWENITSLYGNEPVILGLDTCTRYRSMLSPPGAKGVASTPRVRVAGMFNSGTTALERSLAINLRMNRSPKKENLNVPWGKHIPAKYREVNRSPPNNTESYFHILPVVIVRDPYRWMNSMCKASYSVSWSKRNQICPNLVFVSERGNVTFRVRDKMDDAPGLITEEYQSLAHMWTEWYQQYVEADFPRLIVRFEDTLFHAEKVMKKIAECAGLSPPQRYSYLLTESKEHGQPTNLVSAIRNYGSNVGRHGTMTQDDFEFSKTALSPALMEAFHYKYGEFNPSK